MAAAEQSGNSRTRGRSGPDLARLMRQLFKCSILYCEGYELNSVAWFYLSRHRLAHICLERMKFASDGTTAWCVPVAALSCVFRSSFKGVDACSS